MLPQQMLPEPRVEMITRRLTEDTCGELVVRFELRDSPARPKDKRAEKKRLYRLVMVSFGF